MINNNNNMFVFLLNMFIILQLKLCKKQWLTSDPPSVGGTWLSPSSSVVSPDLKGPAGCNPA